MAKIQIEKMKIKNFKTFADVTIDNIPKYAVFVGANGVGKSTLFNLFEFLKEAMTSNVTTALYKTGGSRGINEVRSRGKTGAIEIELKFREIDNNNLQWKPLITYLLKINDREGRAFVELERLSYRRGNKGTPWFFIDFSNGKGQAVNNELDKINDIKDLVREEQELKAPDILAIKALAQFEKFPAVKLLGDLIENWHISDIKVDHARKEQEITLAEHLARDGSNLATTIDFLYKQHNNIFKEILALMKNRIPGVNDVTSIITEEGKVLLKIKDESLNEAFLARFVSDGTIKMLAYLVLLYDPKPYPLLCVEEPENQLYPSLLEVLAEEFRNYAQRGNQVFVSTHSPNFLNAVNINEVFFLIKKNGYTIVEPAINFTQAKTYADNGDKLGYLWTQGEFEGVNP